MMIWKLKNWLFRLIHPSFWIQNEPTCWEWDAQVRELIAYIERAPFEVRVDQYTAEAGGITLWTSNYPYSYGHTLSGGANKVLPAPITRVRLRRALLRAEWVNKTRDWK